MTRRRYFPTIPGPSSRNLILYCVLCSQILSLQQPPSPPLDPLPSSFSFAESWSCRDADLPRLPAARGPAPLAIPWSPEELPREEVRRAPAVSSQGATAPPTARPAARSCRARRSGAPPPRRREELPPPWPATSPTSTSSASSSPPPPPPPPAPPRAPRTSRSSSARSSPTSSATTSSLPPKVRAPPPPSLNIHLS